MEESAQGLSIGESGRCVSQGGPLRSSSNPSGTVISWLRTYPLGCQDVLPTSQLLAYRVTGVLQRVRASSSLTGSTFHLSVDAHAPIWWPKDKIFAFRPLSLSEPAHSVHPPIRGHIDHPGMPERAPAGHLPIRIWPSLSVPQQRGGAVRSLSSARRHGTESGWLHSAHSALRIDP